MITNRKTLKEWKDYLINKLGRTLYIAEEKKLDYAFAHYDLNKIFGAACELPFLNTDRKKYLDGVSIEHIIEFYEFNIKYCGMIFPFLTHFGILMKKQIKAIFENNQFDFSQSLLSDTNFNILISNVPNNININNANNTFFHKLKNNNLTIDDLKNQLKQKNEIYKYSNL